MKRRTPYDFVAITDHSEYYGVLKDLIDPAKTRFRSRPSPSQLQKMRDRPKAAAGPAVQMLIQTLGAKRSDAGICDVRICGQGIGRSSSPQPTSFTSQASSQLSMRTSGPRSQTAQTCTATSSSEISRRQSLFPLSIPFIPEDLWTYLEVQRNQGIECIAIPHNSNVSDGWMFSPNKFLGWPHGYSLCHDAKAANEPLFEICQTKGNSEAHPWLSPNDEFADFEQFREFDQSRNAVGGEAWLTTVRHWSMG